MIPLVSIFILVSVILSGCYGKSMEELTGHDSYVSAEYGETADNPWKPIGRQERLGMLNDGNPLYGYEGDVERYYVYVGKPGARESQIGMMYRSDVSYPEVTAENVDEIEFRLFGDETEYYTNVIRDKDYIEKVFSILDATENTVYLDSSIVGLEDTIDPVGQINFYNNDLTGLKASTIIVKYKGEYYYALVTDGPGTTLPCVKDEGTIPFER